MHGSLGHFKATLQRKKERKAKAEGRFDNKRLNYKASENKAEFDFPKLSKPELDKVKIEIKHKIRREKILNSIFDFCCFFNYSNFILYFTILIINIKFFLCFDIVYDSKI